MTTLLQLLSEPNRLEIARLLWTGELAAGEIAAHFDSTFGAVSQHLARLHEAGVVRRRRAGRHIYYSLDRTQLGALAPMLEVMWRDKLNVLKALAEAEEKARPAAQPHRGTRTGSRTKDSR